MTDRIYAIGDIHGHLAKLQDAHARIARDHGGKDAPIVHLGDYADRGPDVPGVLQFLLEGRRAGKPWINILGNHDRMMARFLGAVPQPDPLRGDLHWLADNIGGRATLRAYGVNVDAGRAVADIHAEARQKVPREHLAFLETLVLNHRADRLFFCHAGIRPGVPLDAQTEDDLVWIREPFLSDTRHHGALVVHGHTPTDIPTHCGNRLCLDTGAAYGGPLSAAVFEAGRVFLVEDSARRELPPPLRPADAAR